MSELEFIFTSPSFVTEKVTDKLRKERREFFIPGDQAESSLAGSDFEIRRATSSPSARSPASARTGSAGRSPSARTPRETRCRQFAVIDDRAAYTQLQGSRPPISVTNAAMRCRAS